MTWLKRNIPNLFTLSNLALGVLGIDYVISRPNEDISQVFIYIFIAAFFDLLDGLLARLLKVQSAIGAQLDSLADLITFGVLPMFIYAHYTTLNGIGLLVLSVPICSAIRLAKFNLEDEQGGDFKGISTTAHGIFVATIPAMLLAYQERGYDLLLEPRTITLISALFFSVLMVSSLSMLSLKFKTKSIKENWDKYLLLLFTFTMALSLKWMSPVWIMLIYVLLSLSSALIKKQGKITT